MRIRITAFIILLFTINTHIVSAQSGKKSENRCKEEDIPHYKAHKIKAPITIDGNLDKDVWKNAPKSNRFVDLISGAQTHLDTRAAVLWDDEYLYVGYWVEEPDVTATHTQRDALIYEDNDVELFIAGPDGYYELEINAFNTIYEVFFLWKDVYDKKGYNKIAGFEPNAPGAANFNGVGYKHPRGGRMGFFRWDMPGLQTAVQIHGTINDNSDKDKGWTVEVAIPWKSLKIIADQDGRPLPPKNNSVWRMDFSRFNTKKYSPQDAGGWAMSSHGVWDSHVPECFTYVEFVDQPLKK